MKYSGASPESVKILLKGGEYFVNDTVELTEADSGSDFSPLTICAEDNEQVTLKKSVTIPKSEVMEAPESIKAKIIDSSARNNIKYVNLYNLGITDFGKITRRGYGITSPSAQGELYINGKRGTLSRYPNTGYTNDRTEIFNYNFDGTKSIVTDTQTAAMSFTYSDERPSLWTDEKNIWISGSMNANFSFDYLPVKSINAEEKTVTISEGTLKNYHYSKPFYFFENVLCELDRENEYYIDYETGNMYFYPPKNGNYTLEFSVSDTPVFKFSNAKNITLKNINIAYGRGSAITSSGTLSNIKIESCTVHGFGGSGISLGTATFSTVSNSKVYDIGETGIAIGGGDYANLGKNGNLIYNNEVSKCAQLKKSYFSGIHLAYRSIGTTVKNNYIHDMPHAGLIFYGAEHNIVKNEFEKCVTDFHDMNAIYSKLDTFPWEKGNTIADNYFHNLGNEFLGDVRQINVSAIRSDDFGPGLTITHNLFYNIGNQSVSQITNMLGGIVSQGIYNKISYNMFLDCSDTYIGGLTYNGASNNPPKYSDTASDTLKAELATRMSVYGKRFPELKNYLNEHHTVTKTNEFSNNAVINIAYPLSVYNGKMNDDGWRGKSELTNSYGNFVMNMSDGYEAYKSIFEDYDTGSLTTVNLKPITDNIPNFGSFNMSRTGLIK